MTTGVLVTTDVERLDIGMPTPVEVAMSLMNGGFTEDQANTIAAEVYQPIRDMLKALALKDAR